jgi:hypothetical protein
MPRFFVRIQSVFLPTLRPVRTVVSRGADSTAPSSSLLLPEPFANVLTTAIRKSRAARLEVRNDAFHSTRTQAVTGGNRT